MDLHKLRSRKQLRLLCLAVYWVGIFMLTHLPITIPMSAPKNSDLLAHFLMYLGLAMLSGWFWSSAVADGRFRVRLVVLFVVLLIYAAFDEWLQQFVNRTMSFTDWLADAAGLLIGILWLLLASRRAQYRNKPL